MRPFVPVARKVNLIIVISLVVGTGGVIGYFAFSQNRSLTDTTELNLTRPSDILRQSIKNAMLPGEAPIAVQLFTDIRLTNPAYEIILYRADGVEAFSDNSTIETVNAVFGYSAFEPREVFPENRMVMSGDEHFRRAVAERRNQLFRQSTDGGTFVKIYKPLLNLPKCSGCHGASHTVRGVISIASDIGPVVREQRRNLAVAAVLFIAVVLLLTLPLSLYLQRILVRPVKHIGEVCQGVTRGDFDRRVSVRNQDEIGALGETVNEMVQGLYERFQLSKFVSSSTLQSIKNGQKGARTRMVLFFSDIRSFTSSSEGSDPERVVDSLNRVLNVRTQIIHKNGGRRHEGLPPCLVGIPGGDGHHQGNLRGAGVR